MLPRRTLLVAGLAVAAGPAMALDPLAAAVADPARTPRFVARDGARHPVEELGFFGLRSDATVVEMWPGGGYWTEILAPYLREHGRYVAVLQGPTGDPEEDASAAKQASALRAKLAADPGRYGAPAVVEMGSGAEAIADAGSADLVLTFRNLHNWMKSGTAPAFLAAFHRVLKPGGVLGVEEHRGRPDRPQDPRALSGYVRQDAAVAMALAAGFLADGSSEVAANPRDTTDWPEGVWTLPPTLRLGDVDRAKYVAIGEADNFVLRFRRP